MVVLQFRFQGSKIWFFNHDLHERSILGSLRSYFWVLNFNLYSVFLCFNIFVNWCKLLMHISLCIFVNSLWLISWPICKYLESHFFKSYLKLSCGFGVLFVSLFWMGVGGEKGFCTLITQMEIPCGLKQMSHWKQFRYQQNYFRLKQTSLCMCFLFNLIWIITK